MKVGLNRIFNLEYCALPGSSNVRANWETIDGFFAQCQEAELPRGKNEYKINQARASEFFKKPGYF